MNKRLILMLESNAKFAYILIDSALVPFTNEIEEAAREIRNLEKERDELRSERDALLKEKIDVTSSEIQRLEQLNADLARELKSLRREDS